MCGRFTQTATPEVIAEHFHLDEPPLFTPRYNIAPSQQVAAIRFNAETTTRECVMLRWGLIPSWAKDPKIGNQCINAKAETVAEKPSFRSAFKKRRCLVVADGFYEWQVQGTRKQPMWIGLRDRRPFAFAGLWEHWSPNDGEPIESCTIITTEPNELMQPIHNRMPVILAPSSYDQWLDPAFQNIETLNGLLRPYPSEELTAHPVSTLVNNPRHDAPQCLEPVSV
ncbi:MAG: SOS response-associated peptidase [Nitrospiraceae bacterium]